jgi:hypothetical protein
MLQLSLSTNMPLEVLMNTLAWRKSMVTCLVILALIAIGTLPQSSTAAAPPAPPDPIEVNADEVEAGDVIARGVVRDGTMCQVPTFGIRTPSLGNGQQRWIAVEMTGQCEVVVVAKWVGGLADGPRQVAEPLLALIATQSDAVPEQWAPAMSSLGTAAVTKGTRPVTGVPSGKLLRISQSNLLWASKTSSQHVYMFGGGGPLDQLTHKYGQMTFSYNGSSATLDSHGGSCAGSDPFSWHWVVDNCRTVHVTWGPGSYVGRVGDGSYHCDPTGSFPCNLSDPDGFYHTLLDEEDGYADGHSTCYASYSGIIVLGYGQQFVQGCS